MIKKLIITITLMATLIVGAIGIIYSMNNSVADERNNTVKSIELNPIEVETIKVENIETETIETENILH